MRTLTPALVAAALALAAPAAPALADAAAGILTASPAGMPVAAGRLTPLATSTADLVFSGETQTRDIVFVVQPEQTAGAISLVLNVQSAISDDPDNSRMAVRINGHDLGTLPLKSGTPQSVEIPVPPGVIEPGYNALTITVDQIHRVDCSIPATYELWTRIDPTLSGFAYASAATLKDDFASVLAMARTDDGATDIHGRIAEGTDRSALMTAIQALTIAASFDRPRVDFGSDPGTGPGVDVVVGTPQSVAAALGADGVDAPLHEGANFLHAGNGSRMIVAVVGQTAEDLDRQIKDLANYGTQVQYSGTPQALAVLTSLRGLPVMPGDKVNLSQLGIDDRTFSGRRFHQTVSFSMPDDFYPADYARAGLHLNARYARNLADGAQMHVALNGETVSTIGLGGSRIGEINGQVLPISLSAFRPGLNTLTIDAELPTTSDKTCAPLHVSDGGRLRLIGNTSYLQIPNIARVGRFPDLAMLPAAIDGRKPGETTVDVLAGDGAALNAAGTFLAKLAFSGNRLIRARLDTGGSYNPAVPTLAIGEFGSIPLDVVSAVNVDLSRTEGMVAPDPGLGGTADAADAGPADGSLVDTAQNKVGLAQKAARATAIESLRQVRQALVGLGNSIGLSMDFLRSGNWGEPPFQPDPGTALLIAEEANAAGTAPVVMVAAPSAARLQSAVDQLVAGGSWDRLGGSVMTLSDQSEVLQKANSGGTRLFVTQPIGFSNGPLITAGWLSNNPAIYVMLLVLFAVLLGVTTWLVLLFGRRVGR